MAIHFRPAPLLAMLGVLALGGASVARAQDTSAAARTDTSGYQPYQNRTDSTQAGKDTTSTDSSGFKYTGPSTDTTLKAAPGAQTGPSTDSTQAGKDTASTDSSGFKYTGPSTDTTLKAAPGAQTGPSTDSTQAGKDTASTDSSGFKYTGPSTDTTLKAAPGAQTGPSKDSGSAAAPSGMSAADSVVCKDGSNEGNRGGVSCGGHGGIDSVSTTAAMKARGWLGKSDSSASKDTSSSSEQKSP
jgi:hypothetical protein